MVCRKLALQEGERVLDVGCGWGSFPLWAATRHGARVVGITLSPPQAEKARQRAEAAGVADRVEIRVMDYRDLAGERFDAIASIGMVEHVGSANIDVYARTLAGLLEPGGRLLNHGITRLRHTDAEAGPFSERYVFPDAAPAAPLAGPAGAGTGRLRHPPRRGVRRRLRRDPAPLGESPRREPRRGGAPRRPRAGPRLAPLPARRPQRLRERLHLDLPGPLHPGLADPGPGRVITAGARGLDREAGLDGLERPVGAGLASSSTE